jgi:hypothetical protein
MGHVSISTEPGGIIHVNIIGRTDALDTVGPYANGCHVMLGHTVEDRFVTPDATGSGTATFGPGETSATIDGDCGSKQNTAQTADMFAPHDVVCLPAPPGAREQHCIKTGTYVTIDGGPPVVAPNYPRPAPPQQAAPRDCNDSMRQTFDQYGWSADVADLGMALAKKPGLKLGVAGYGACALLAQNPQDFFYSLCNVGRSMIPADWAYLAITQLGKSISNDQIERFGEISSQSWDQQCRA